MAQLNLKISVASTIPTPPSGYLAIFIDSADNEVKVKDSTGTVFPLSSTALSTLQSDLTQEISDRITQDGLLQDQIDDLNINKEPANSNIQTHIAATNNPHSTTKAQVGLGNVDNTSDVNKPVSTATQTALNGKENTITAGTTSQYYRGDKSFQTLDKTAVGLPNVDNTSDLSKPVSTATQIALNGKENAFSKNTGFNLNLGTTSGTVSEGNHTHTPSQVGLGNVLNVAQIPTTEKGAVNGVATLDGTGKVPSSQLPSFVDDVVEYANLAAFPVTGTTGIIYVALNTNKTYRWTGTVYVEISASDVNSVNGFTGAVTLTKTDIGLGNVDNTSDLNKPISTATQTALNLKYNASNPNGYETPTQLNARDTANRDRANHTGIQSATTISNFQATVSVNTDVTANTAARHTHSNKTILDLITEAFTTALKTAYDSTVTWITTNGTNLINHLSNTSNPHSTTKTQVGLGNADNTSDLNKPISTATQTALNGKQDTLVSGTTIKTINNQTLLGSGNFRIANYGTAINVSTAGNTTITLTAGRNIEYYDINAAAGTYVRNVRLANTNAVAGDEISILLSLPASTGVTINYIDDASSANIITLNSEAIVNPLPVLNFIFNGTAWDWRVGGGMPYQKVAIANTDAQVRDYLGITAVTNAIQAEIDVWTEIKLPSNVTNNTITPAAITGLATSVIATCTHRLEYTILFSSASAAVGIGLTLTTPDGAAGNFSLATHIPIAADGTAAEYQGTINAFNDVVLGTAVPLVNGLFIAQIIGIFNCTTGGTIQPSFRSETAGTTVTVYAGSTVLDRVFP